MAELSSVGGIAITTETIDVSNHDTQGEMREFIPSFKDAGFGVLAEGYIERA